MVHVGDRGADRWDFMHRCLKEGQGFIVRAMYDRKVKEDARLWEWMGAQALAHEYVLEVPSKDTRGRVGGKREAKLEVRHARVEIPPPVKDARHENKEPMRLWAVYVSEGGAPEGSEQVEWMLLTSEPIESKEQACESISHYQCRWTIEEWHRCMKQGCGLESAQLKSAEAIKKLAVMHSVVAVRLLQLRDTARDKEGGGKPAREAIDEVTVKVVEKLSGKKRLSVREFWEQVGRLGGWMGRKNDRSPGWITIWKGWKQIELIVTGFKLHTNLLHVGVEGCDILPPLPRGKEDSLRSGCQLMRQP